jgi:hypothetical protein
MINKTLQQVKAMLIPHVRRILSQGGSLDALVKEHSLPASLLEEWAQKTTPLPAWLRAPGGNDWVQCLEQLLAQCAPDKLDAAYFRALYPSQLDTFARGHAETTSILLLSGETQSRKTTVMASAFSFFHKGGILSPRPLRHSMAIVGHFSGMSPWANTAWGTLDSIAVQLFDAGVLVSLPEKREARDALVRETLQNTSLPLLICLDGLPEDALAWIPETLSDRVKMIITLRPDALPRMSARRDVTLRKMPPMTEQAGLAMLREYAGEPNSFPYPTAHEVNAKIPLLPSVQFLAWDIIGHSQQFLPSLPQDIGLLVSIRMSQLEEKYGEKISLLLRYAAISLAPLSSEVLSILLPGFDVNVPLSVTRSLLRRDSSGSVGLVHPVFAPTLQKEASTALYQALAEAMTQRASKEPSLRGVVIRQWLMANDVSRALSLLVDFSWIESMVSAGLTQQLLADLQQTADRLGEEIVTIDEVTIDAGTLRILSAALSYLGQTAPIEAGGLFQGLYNLCFWYENPSLSNYLSAAIQTKEHNIHRLMARWRSTQRSMWLRAIRPQAPLLSLQDKFFVAKDTLYRSALDDARSLLAMCSSYHLTVWNIQSGEVLARFSLASSTYDSPFFHPTKPWVAVYYGRDTNAFHIFDISTGKPLFYLRTSNDPKYYFNKDGYLIEVRKDGATTCRDIETNTIVQGASSEAAHTQKSSWRVEPAPGGFFLRVGESPALVSVGDCDLAIFTPDGERVVIGGSGASVWFVKDGTLKKKLTGAGVKRISEDGKYLLSDGVDYGGMADYNEYVEAFDIETGEQAYYSDNYKTTGPLESLPKAREAQPQPWSKSLREMVKWLGVTYAGEALQTTSNGTFLALVGKDSWWLYEVENYNTEKIIPT